MRFHFATFIKRAPLHQADRLSRLQIVNMVDRSQYWRAWNRRQNLSQGAVDKYGLIRTAKKVGKRDSLGARIWYAWFVALKLGRGDCFPVLKRGDGIVVFLTTGAEAGVFL